MKKLVFFLLMFCIIGVMSSCATRKGCNGSWYNNRNVQVEPTKKQLKSLDFEEEWCKEDDTEYSE